jgi:hypothetical protein
MHRLKGRVTKLERHVGVRQRQLLPGVYFLGDAAWRTAPLDTPVLVLGGTREEYLSALRVLSGAAALGDCPRWQTLRDSLEAYA